VPAPARAEAFTLVELLAVVATIAVLAALSLSGWRAVSGMQLKSAAEAISDAVSLAKQTSSATGRETRVAFFYEAEDGLNRIKGYQVQEVIVDSDGTPMVKGLTRKFRLPDSVVFDENNSPLLADKGDWSGFRFRPGGRPDRLSYSNNYLRIHPRSFPGPEPANYIFIQVNPLNGRVQQYQP